MAIKNILFDLGNVLFRLDLPRWNREVQALLHPVHPLELQEAAQDYETGRISTELFINAVLAKCHHSRQAIDVLQVWNSMLIGFVPEYLKVLDTLKKDYQVYLLSNNNPLHQQWVYQELEHKYGILDFNERFFHATFYSHEIGVSKPHEDSFDQVIQQTGLCPEETIYFDDDPHNIATGRTLGFQAVLVKNADHTLELLAQHRLVRT